MPLIKPTIVLKGNMDNKLTIIFREADAEVDFLDLHLKEIFLVEEKHNRRFCEEPVVADAVE